MKSMSKENKERTWTCEVTSQAALYIDQSYWPSDISIAHISELRIEALDLFDFGTLALSRPGSPSPSLTTKIVDVIYSVHSKFLQQRRCTTSTATPKTNGM